MKLAVALQERSDLQQKVSELDLRLRLNATYQEDEKPAEDISALLKELEEALDRLEVLIARIHKTNLLTEVEGKSLTELLARREVLTLKRRSLVQLSDEASSLTPRHGRSEIKVYPSVDVSALRKNIDKVSKELREIEMLIQEANWTTELK